MPAEGKPQGLRRESGYLHQLQANEHTSSCTTVVIKQSKMGAAGGKWLVPVGRRWRCEA